ncbi:P-loop containing nucleoside triphosphate hydrolase protein [Meredithblackwellia eburnea MCA 4105]
MNQLSRASKSCSCSCFTVTKRLFSLSIPFERQSRPRAPAAQSLATQSLDIPVSFFPDAAPRQKSKQFFFNQKGKYQPPSAQQPTQKARASFEQLQKKLWRHLKSTWLLSHGAPSLPIQELAKDLNLDLETLGHLCHTFAKQGGLSGGYDVYWDWDALATAYDDHVKFRQIVLVTFIKWAGKYSPPSSNPYSFSRPDRTLSTLYHLSRLTDHRYPGQLYPDAREQKRKLILHVGPTNSGKTYRALMALSQARTGVYAGPLRLLAHEVFSRFNSGSLSPDGKPRACNLITGEEKKIVDPLAGLSSCTVEMFPIGKKFDVGVIDEIQMLGDEQRGTAWTNALIASQCDELHLCGEESIVSLVTSIAKELGDEVIVHRYERLSPLKVSQKSLGSDLSKISRGDCLVTFSRNNIFAFKRLVEDKTGLRVAVAYGGLPPEVREEQARAFNAGEYDVLVASDAVGMGLNLKIRRIVFETLTKFDGKAEVSLSMPQIKQIAGRAGRYGVHSETSSSSNAASGPDVGDSSREGFGEATTLDEADMDLLRRAIKHPVIQVNKAILEPPQETLRDIYHLLPSTLPLSKLTAITLALVRTSENYLSPRSLAPPELTDALEKIQPLTFQEKLTFAHAPVNNRDPIAVGALVGFADRFARGDNIVIEEWSEEIGLEDLLRDLKDADDALVKFGSKPRPMTTQHQLAKLEIFHRCLTLYLWLSYRLPLAFTDYDNAVKKRKEVEKVIEKVLSSMRFERLTREERRKKGLLAKEQFEKDIALLGEGGAKMGGAEIVALA